MSQKPYVIVPHRYDLLTTSAPNFNSADHRHVTASQRDKLLLDGDIEVLDGPALIWRYTERKAATRGLSAKLGSTHALAVTGMRESDQAETVEIQGRTIIRNKIVPDWAARDWALVMRDEIRA